MNRSRNKAFTLIELLVVVAIIALLSAVVLSGLREAREKAAIEKIRETANQIKIAIELYKNTNGVYPPSNEIQIDPWGNTSWTGAIGSYIKDIQITDDNIYSFQFRASNLGYGNAMYYTRINPAGDIISSCDNVPAGQYVPYAFWMVIEPASFDLKTAYGFPRYTEYNRTTGVLTTPYSDTYCLITPPY